MECSEANVKKIKKCLSNILDKEESILEFATVKLSICSPQTEKVFRSFIKEGILCVIINRITSCLYLKLFELIQFHKVFEVELYTNISDGYTVRDNNFHIIEFPGFFLGLSFPIIENQNVSNRSSLIQKAIISTSKFISINLSDYIYLHQFDFDKSSKKIAKMKTYMKKGFKSQLSKDDKQKFVKINESPKYGNEQGSNELFSNKIKFSANMDGKININENSIKNNNEFDSTNKMKSSNLTSNNNTNTNNNLTSNNMTSNITSNNMTSNYMSSSNQRESFSDSNSSNSNNSQSKSNSNNNEDNDNDNENDNENDSLSVTNYNNQERVSAYISSKDRNIKGILKKSISSNINNEDRAINSKEKSTQILIESKEKNLFDSITIEDSSDKKIYKIVQFHILKDKMKLVKKLFKKNFYRFISADKISFDNIREYKINTYDFLNDEDYSSEEDEGQKTFVDYVPSNDMIGILENQQDIQDERLLELMQQKKNLKEISRKREDGIPKTTSIYN